MLAAWIIFLLSATVFVLLATVNAVLMWRIFVLRQENVPSIVPIVGGCIGAIGFGVSPLQVLSDHAWLPLLLDFGCVLYLLLATPALLVDWWHTSRFNLVTRYQSLNCTDGNLTLRLFRKNICWLQKHWDPKPDPSGTISMSATGEWTIDDDVLLVQIGACSVRFHSSLDGSLEWLSSSSESVMDGIRFIRC